MRNVIAFAILLVATLSIAGAAVKDIATPRVQPNQTIRLLVDDQLVGEWKTETGKVVVEVE